MIYVAGKLESGIVGGIIDRLHREDVPVFDWRGIDARKPYTENPQVNDAAALFMDYGVRQSDWLILVVEPGVYGGMVELGMAIAYCNDLLTRKRITVALPDDMARESVFFAHPEVETLTLDELYVTLGHWIDLHRDVEEVIEVEADE